MPFGFESPAPLKRLGKAFGLAAALAHSPAMTPEAVAQNSTVEVAKEEVTASGEWVRPMLHNFAEAVKTVDSSEDAERLVSDFVAPIIKEFYFPTKGNTHEGSHGVVVREYSRGDLHLLLDSTKESMKQLEILNAKYPFSLHEKMRDQLGDMVAKLERRLE